MYLHTGDVCTEISHLCAEDEITPLCISQKDDKEHDGKTSNVFCATTQCRLELSHGLVEADVLEHFDPGEKHSDGNKVIVLFLPVTKLIKACILCIILQQSCEQFVHLKCTVYVEYDANDSHHNNNDVKDVPKIFKVFQLMSRDFDSLLNGVVDEKQEEDEFARHHKVIHCSDVPQKLQRTELVIRNAPTSGRVFQNQPTLIK